MYIKTCPLSSGSQGRNGYPVISAVH
jgi:hypothetical protein